VDGYDIITLRKCQHQVIQLAANHKTLCRGAGRPIEAGPDSFQCPVLTIWQDGQVSVAVEGTNRGQTSLRLSGLPYPSSIMYNVAGPGDWELLNCHVFVGALSCSSSRRCAILHTTFSCFRYGRPLV
jgi:hypothetical protein